MNNNNQSWKLTGQGMKVIRCGIEYNGESGEGTRCFCSPGGYNYGYSDIYYSCACGCLYAGQPGGSSSEQNRDANHLRAVAPIKQA